MLVFTVFTPEFLAGVVAAPFGLIRQKMAKQYTRVRSSYVYIYISYPHQVLLSTWGPDWNCLADGKASLLPSCMATREGHE